MAFDQNGEPCENLALDEKLGEQVNLLRTTKSIFEATQDPEVLRNPFKQLGLYEDVYSHAEIEIAWSQWRAAQPKNK